MKTIKLTQGLEAMVDDEDFLFLSSFKWIALKSRNTFYASRHNKYTCPNGRNGKRVYDGPANVSMARQIMNFPDGMVDHIDGNGLNNQRINLRLADAKQNQWNSSKHKDGCSSKYKGVSWDKRTSKWKTSFGSPARKGLGYYATETEAALAYNFAAVHRFGEFARLNDVHL